MSRINLTVQMTGLLTTSPAQQRTAMQQGIGRGVFEIVEAVADLARQNAPSGARGLLRANIRTDVQMQERHTEGLVFTTTAVPYAPFVEFGTTPRGGQQRRARGRGGREDAFIRELKLWARRVLGDERAAYAVRWKIWREGTPAQRFLGRAVETIRPRMQRIVDRAVSDALARLRGEA